MQMDKDLPCPITPASKSTYTVRAAKSVPWTAEQMLRLLCMTYLHVVFVTPLSGEVGLRPALVAVHERYMIPHIATSKVFVSVVGKHLREKFGCVAFG